MLILEDAIILAARSHKGQQDKAGEAYILHPLRLMLSMTTEAERMVAVLHDVVEDSGDNHRPVTLADLEAAGYPAEHPSFGGKRPDAAQSSPHNIGARLARPHDTRCYFV